MDDTILRVGDLVLRRMVSRALRRLDSLVLRTRFGSGWTRRKWRWRHIYRRQWATRYLETRNAPHRTALTEIVSSRFPTATSIMEFGCGSGANLFNLWEARAARRLLGVDVNPAGVAAASRHAERTGASGLTFRRLDATRIDASLVGTHDLVITDAFLMYVDHRRIREVLATMLDATRLGLLLHEFNGSSAVVDGRTIHDFPSLLHELAPGKVRVDVFSSPKDGDKLWTAHGAFVVVSVTDGMRG